VFAGLGPVDQNEKFCIHRGNWAGVIDGAAS
jgi:hypothetical protein